MSHFRFFLVPALIISATLALSPASFAALVLDQVHDPTTSSRFNQIGLGGLQFAQTFTVGLTGTLTGFDVRMNAFIPPLGTGDMLPLLFDIRTTAGGIPTTANVGANILASGTIPFADLPGSQALVNFDISSHNVGVTTGDVLAITLRSDSSGVGYGWFGSNTDYAGGAQFLRLDSNPINAWSAPGSGGLLDMNFRTSVQPIPEPSSALLLGFCFLPFAARSRRAPRRQH